MQVASDAPPGPAEKPSASATGAEIASLAALTGAYASWIVARRLKLRLGAGSHVPEGVRTIAGSYVAHGAPPLLGDGQQQPTVRTS